MRTRIAVSIFAAGALSLPAVALAELGPHSSYYDVNPSARGEKNDLSVDVVRNKHQAYFNVINFCLGKGTYSGHTYPLSASLPPTSRSHTAGITVSDGRVSYHGKAVVSSQTGTTEVPASVEATVGPKKVVGSVTLPGKCGTIRFTAKLQGSTK